MREGQTEIDQELWDRLMREKQASRETTESPLQTVEETEKEMPGVPVVKIPLP